MKNKTLKTENHSHLLKEENSNYFYHFFLQSNSTDQHQYSFTHSTYTPQTTHLLYVQRWYVADLTCLFQVSSLVKTTTYQLSPTETQEAGDTPA